MRKDAFHVKNFIMLTIAGVINAFGVTFFLYPVNLYDSGISGTSMLLAQVTPDYLSLSLFLVLINFPLFLYGYKKMGITFTVYSVYAVFVYSVTAWLITDVLPVDVSIASPLAEQDLLLCAIFGGLISGMGSNHPQTICEALSDEFENGITLMDAKGYYSDKEKTLIYFVVNRFQINKVRQIVQEQDPNAYVTITEVSDVLGNE